MFGSGLEISLGVLEWEGSTSKYLFVTYEDRNLRNIMFSSDPEPRAIYSLNLSQWMKTLFSNSASPNQVNLPFYTTKIALRHSSSKLRIAWGKIYS